MDLEKIKKIEKLKKNLKKIQEENKKIYEERISPKLEELTTDLLDKILETFESNGFNINKKDKLIEVIYGDSTIIIRHYADHGFELVGDDKKITRVVCQLNGTSGYTSYPVIKDRYDKEIAELDHQIKDANLTRDKFSNPSFRFDLISLDTKNKLSFSSINETVKHLFK